MWFDAFTAISKSYTLLSDVLLNSITSMLKIILQNDRGTFISCITLSMSNNLSSQKLIVLAGNPKEIKDPASCSTHQHESGLCNLDVFTTKVSGYSIKDKDFVTLRRNPPDWNKGHRITHGMPRFNLCTIFLSNYLQRNNLCVHE